MFEVDSQTYNATENEYVEVEKGGERRILDEAEKGRVLLKCLVFDARMIIERLRYLFSEWRFA